ncbi:2-hydroxyacid dehydrogenase [Chondrinema litorale]|uniref:2-hydroxyacid dehydrogenase n=1 Tax=Chondrinema litorale TaxID=2994555 RepID=UPI002542D751|nr:glyoxylate/hydroxypyruvate reductase A [Chondrinema litorale]UZR94228.1 glyoxylate/hydroxypyruvate reductase A [Chondrinema litorale]
MSIVVIAPEPHLAEVKSKLCLLLPEVSVFTINEVENTDDIDFAVLWKKTPEHLKDFPKLKLVCSLGAGVDHIMSYALPNNLKIARIGDAGLSGKMSKYVQAAIYHWEHRFLEYAKYQSQNLWKPMIPRKINTVGIMGLGVIGTRVAKDLVSNGYKVKGYSRSLKSIEFVYTFAGENNLESFLENLDCLVCLLPLTDQTKHIVNLPVFQQLNKGAFFINVARGAVLNENDLLEALELGFISEAFLDVFEKEPLPTEHPFWSHTKISITPHVASLTDLDRACKQLAENYFRLKRGDELLFEVDRVKGY